MHAFMRLKKYKWTLKIYTYLFLHAIFINTNILINYGYIYIFKQNNKYYYCVQLYKNGI